MTTIKKDSFTISELAREFDVTPRALRFYEDKGLLAPGRDGMNRVFSLRDRARLKLILLGRKVGFSLNDIREILDLYDLDDGQRTQLEHTYKKHKQQIEVLKQQRVEIDEAIAMLKDGVNWIEGRLEKMGPPEQKEDKARAYDAVARAHFDDDTVS